MKIANDENIEEIMKNLGAVINSPEIQELGAIHKQKAFELCDSFIAITTDDRFCVELLGTFILLHKLYDEFKALIGYQHDISNLINKRALEMR